MWTSGCSPMLARVVAYPAPVHYSGMSGQQKFCHVLVLLHNTLPKTLLIPECGYLEACHLSPEVRTLLLGLEPAPLVTYGHLVHEFLFVLSQLELGFGLDAVGCVLVSHGVLLRFEW